MTLMEKMEQLFWTFDPDDKEEAAKLIIAANDYIHSVTVMLAENRNYFNRTDEALRTAKETADRERRNCHNAFIDRTNLVNRMCEYYHLDPIYSGDETRKAYGDFAMELVSAMFQSR